MPAARSALIFLTAGLALGACKKSDSGKSEKKAAAATVDVPLLTATEAPTPVQLTLTGLVKADQRSEVTADTQGKVIDVLVDRGQRVKIGQPLVRLDVRTASLSAREAQANLASARASRQLADEECKRAETLIKSGAITRSDYDRQVTQCQQSLQQVAAAEVRSQMMSKSIADGMVRSPFEGIIDARNVTPGEWVAPGRSLFTLVDDDPLKIELSVPEASVNAIQHGQTVVIRAVAFKDETFTAKVTRVGAEIGRSRALIVEAEIEKGSKLVPGMFAEATVTVGAKPRVVLPESAVVLRGKSRHAFVVVDGALQDRIVQIGPVPAPGQVSIVQGVAAGDRVVATVTDAVVDGVRVNSPDAPKAPATPAAPAAK